MSNTTRLWISDQSQKKYWDTLCSTAYKAPEIRNLRRKFTEAKQHPEMYSFIDWQTAQIFEDGLPLIENFDNLTDEQILAEFDL